MRQRMKFLQHSEVSSPNWIRQRKKVVLCSKKLRTDKVFATKLKWKLGHAVLSLEYSLYVQCRVREFLCKYWPQACRIILVLITQFRKISRPTDRRARGLIHQTYGARTVVLILHDTFLLRHFLQFLEY